MGFAPSTDKEIKLEPAINVVLKFSFKDLWKLVKQLPDKQQVKMLDKLKKELEKKGLINWSESAEMDLNYLRAKANPNPDYKKPLVSMEDMQRWREEVPEEDEIEMTEEEFYKAVEEMS